MIDPVTLDVTAEGWPTVRRVTMLLCDDCLDGKGGECHTPGCAMWLNRAPDLPLRNHPCVEIEEGPL